MLKPDLRTTQKIRDDKDKLDKELQKLKADVLALDLIVPKKEDARLLAKLNRAMEIVRLSNYYKDFGMANVHLIAAVFAKMK